MILTTIGLRKAKLIQIGNDMINGYTICQPRLLLCKTSIGSSGHGSKFSRWMFALIGIIYSMIEIYGYMTKFTTDLARRSVKSRS